MDLDVGVVCRSALASQGRQGSAEAYVVGHEGRLVWLEAGEERSRRVGGHGLLAAVARGDGGGAVASAAASAAVAVLGRLYGPPPRDPRGALADYLSAAHTRMYWQARQQDAAQRPAASVAVGWWVDDVLVWAVVGDGLVWRLREGRLEALGLPWEAGRRQRFIRGSRGLGDDTAVHLREGVNIGMQSMAPGDRVVVATGGLGGLHAAELRAALEPVTEVQAAAVATMERAVLRGGASEITVVVVDRPRPAPRVAVEDTPASALPDPEALGAGDDGLMPTPLAPPLLAPTGRAAPMPPTPGVLVAQDPARGRNTIADDPVAPPRSRSATLSPADEEDEPAPEVEAARMLAASGRVTLSDEVSGTRRRRRRLLDT